MAKIGEFNFDDFKEIGKNLAAMEKAYPAFVLECVRELAGRLLAKTVARTPVGEYSPHVKFTTKEGEVVEFMTKTTRKGGTLRRGWTIGPIQRTPDGGYLVEIINPVEYSLYVEHGHRTADHKGWVEGRFMLTISLKELEQEMPAFLNRKLQEFINRHMR